MSQVSPVVRAAQCVSWIDATTRATVGGATRNECRGMTRRAKRGHAFKSIHCFISIVVSDPSVSGACLRSESSGLEGYEVKGRTLFFDLLRGSGFQRRFRRKLVLHSRHFGSNQAKNENGS
ncbi:hypothetical protein IF2G_06351 [Cordyceps javanica]|nr:hypothetical protein IF2G_06351 [Cordyceps javanica]